MSLRMRGKLPFFAASKPAPAEPRATGAGPAAPVPDPAKPNAFKPEAPKTKIAEIGGPTGPEPTRYGDWERNGKVSDF